MYAIVSAKTLWRNSQGSYKKTKSINKICFLFDEWWRGRICRHITLPALKRVCITSGCYSTTSLAIDPILIHLPLKLPAQVPWFRLGMSLDVSRVGMRHYGLNYIFHVPTPPVWILVVAGPIIASPVLVRICLFFRCVSLRSICIERNDNMFAVVSVFFFGKQTWKWSLDIF